MLPPGSIGEAVLVTSIGTTVLVTSGDGIIAVLIGQVVLVSPIDTTVHKTSGDVGIVMVSIGQAVLVTSIDTTVLITSGGCRHCYGVNWVSGCCDINRYSSDHNIIILVSIGRQ